MTTGGAALRIADSPPTGRDEIAVWLETLDVLLHMPEARRESIHDELETHLRERVRDLLLGGKTESEAVRTAIGELGDAMRLAQRLRAAGRGPRRRLAMNMALFGIAGAALVTSMAALTGGGVASRVWGGQPAPAAYAPEAEVAPSDLRVSITPGMTVREFVDQVSAKAGVPVLAHWRVLEGAQIGMDRNLDVEAELAELTLGEALGYINEAMAREELEGLGWMNEDRGMDYRMSEGRLTLSTVEYFDRREMVLVAYGLERHVEGRARVSPDASVHQVSGEVVEEVVGVIQDLVHPDLWVDNGGDRASVSAFGSTIFVRAPKRFHPQIEWVLGQLPVEGGEATAAAEAGAADTAR